MIETSAVAAFAVVVKVQLLPALAVFQAAIALFTQVAKAPPVPTKTVRFRFPFCQSGQLDKMVAFTELIEKISNNIAMIAFRGGMGVGFFLEEIFIFIGSWVMY
jgi:hypothetical protein